MFIGVGTPEKKDDSANLIYIWCEKQIAESVESDWVVVVKSTVPIGTKFGQLMKKAIVLNVRNCFGVDKIKNTYWIKVTVGSILEIAFCTSGNLIYISKLGNRIIRPWKLELILIPATE